MKDFTEKEIQFLNLTKTNITYKDSFSMGLSVYKSQWPYVYVTNIDLLDPNKYNFDLRKYNRWALVYDEPLGKRVIKYVSDEIIKSEVGNYIIKEFAHAHMSERDKILFGQPIRSLN